MKFKRDKSHGMGSEWVEWLHDEPLPEHAQQLSPKQPVADRSERIAGIGARERLRRAGLTGKALPQESVGAPTISIHINLPKVSLPKVKIPYKQVRYWSVFAVFVLGASIGTRSLIWVVADRHHSGGSEVKGAATSAANQTPAFTPAVPKGKKDLAKSDGETSRYIANKQTYTFVDSLLGSQITISEQSLPASMKQNPNLLSQMAATIGAKEKFETAFGSAYVATSENRTSQRVVFVHKDLLIFIESIKSYDNDAWKLYIESLQ